MADDGGNKLGAALSQGGVALGTLFTIFGAMQFVTPQQVADLTAAVHQFNDSILSAYGALTKMWVILGPAGLLLAARFGLKSPTVKDLAARLLSIATGSASASAVEAQKAIVNATGVIAQDKTIPASEDAKQTLIAATIALPEVQTIVTDKKTADAAPSESVVAAEAIKIVPK